jgi:subtilisin family serine protease
MRSFVLLIIYFFVSKFLFAQPKLASIDRSRISRFANTFETLKCKSVDELSHNLPIQKINGIHYLCLIGKVNSNFDPICLMEKKWLVGKPIGQITSVKVPIHDLGSIASAEEFDYLGIANNIRNQLEKAVNVKDEDNEVFEFDLPKGYSGDEIYIGITDWGFDYTSPMFYDSAQQQTRIVSAWDQFKRSGPSPMGFDYGAEYNSAQELLDAKSDTATIYSFTTHGTHVAGIAGGSGAGTIYKGVASNSKFLFATFLANENAVLDAWEWMYHKAKADQKRLIINMSWGLYQHGMLDGTSLLSQVVSAYTDSGVVFVNSAGNNGNVNFHIKRMFNDDVLKTKIDFSPNHSHSSDWTQCIHAWGEVGKSFSNGIIITNSNGSILAESPYYSTNLFNDHIDTFIVSNEDTIWYNIFVDHSHPLNSKPHQILQVKKKNASLQVLLKSTAITGTVHYWNTTELNHERGNWGMNFLNFGDGAEGGDNQYGIGEPACADDIISVGAHNPKGDSINHNFHTPSIAKFSSLGPRYDGKMKPDIAAPGVNVVSSISSFSDDLFNSISSVDFRGRTYHFAKFSGTSMASPFVAGVSALILDANPYLSARQVKEIIMQSADQNVLNDNQEFNDKSKWGAGRINPRNAINLALQTIGSENSSLELSWTVYPNPVMNELHFTIVEELPKMAAIFDEFGNYFEKPIVNGKVFVSDIPKGQYFIRLIINGWVQQDKFIKR